MQKRSVLLDGSGVLSANEDRRAAVRYRVRLVVSYQDGEYKLRRARVRNVSSLGVAIVLSQPLDLASLIEMELTEKSGILVALLLARVVHAEQDGDSWLIGLAFINELTNEEMRMFEAHAVRASVTDNRRWIRFPCDVETVCYTCDAIVGERRKARVVNVSAGGVGLLLPCEFALGTILHFDTLGDVQQPMRSLLVRVVRVYEQNEGCWFHGCEFAHQLNDEDMRDLLDGRD